MNKLDKLHPSLRGVASNGLDPSLTRLAIIAALPFLACIVIVFHDPGVSGKILLALLIVFAVSGLIAGALSYFFIAREERTERR
jgi:preprotein translocase subunit SecF